MLFHLVRVNEALPGRLGHNHLMRYLAHLLGNVFGARLTGKDDCRCWPLQEGVREPSRSTKHCQARSFSLRRNTLHSVMQCELTVTLLAYRASPNNHYVTIRSQHA